MPKKKNPLVTYDIGPFAIVPLWLIETASPNAVKMYALLWAKYGSREIDNEARNIFPGQSTIGKELDWSVRTVRRTIQELIDTGAMTVTDRRAENKTNLYTLITYKSKEKKYKVLGTPKI